MNVQRSFERFVADSVSGASGGIPMPDDFYDDIHAYASRTRQRPEWLALIKEPPMHTSFGVSVGSPMARAAAVLAATLALLVFSVAAVFAASTLLTEDTPAERGDWPMFKRDAARTGGAPDGPVGAPVLRWRYTADGPVSPNVSIVGDLVYIASDEGVLRAVGREDGLERWRYATDIPPVAGPTVVDGVVYALAGREVMVAIDALTGAERWRSTVPLPGGSGPVPGKDALLVGTETGDLVAIDAASGAEAWRAQVSPSGGGVHTAAYSDGRAFVASDGGGFVAVDVATHEILWRFDTGAAQTGTAGVIDGIAYIGASAEDDNGFLWAVDATSGDELWRIDQPISTPAVEDGVGYSGSVSGLITAFDTASGAIRWQTSVEGMVRPIAIADGVVYVPADAEQRVYALDAETGVELWRFDLDAGTDCCIAVAHGSVFVGTRLGSVYAIGGDGGEPPGPALSDVPESALEPDGPVVSGTGAAPSATRSRDYLTDAPPATLEWSTDGGPDPMLYPSGVAIAPDGRIWVIDSGNSRIGIFEPDGTLVEYWGTEESGPGEFVLHRANGDGSSNVAFAPDGSFYILDAGGMQIQHWSADRQLLREWGGFGNEPGMFIAPGWLTTDEIGNVYVVDAERNVVEVFDPQGNVLRTFEASDQPGTAWTTAVDGQGDIWVSTCCPDAVLREFDPTGRLLRTVDQESAAALVFDPEGRIFGGQFPAPGARDLIVVFDQQGDELARFGGVPGTPDGMGFPWGIALDGSGNVYVSNYGAEDGTTGSLHKYRLQGELTTPPA